MANPVFVKTTDSYIAALMKVTLNAAPGYTYLTQFRSFVTENGGGTTGLQKLGSALANYASTDNATFAASVVSNLGITGASATTATTNVKALLDSYGADRGKALMQLVDIMVNLQSDATWGTAANAFVNSANAGYVYSVNTANTSTDLTTLAAAVSTDASGNAAGQTFTLTANTDNIVGTGGDDLISGSSATFNSDDMINGGQGKDILTMTTAPGTAATVIANVSNVETIKVTNGGSAEQILNMIGATGATELVSRLSGADVTFSNVQEAAKVTAYGTTAGTVKATFLDSLASGTADSANIKADGAATATFEVKGTGDGRFETINLESAGAQKNTVSLATATQAGLKTLAVTGAADLAVSLEKTVAAATYNGSAATGAQTVAIAAGDTGSASLFYVETVKTGSGNDTIDVTDLVGGSRTATTFLGSTNKKTIDGGAGTNTLKIKEAFTTLAAANATDGTAQTHSITNISVIDQTANAAVDATLLDGAQTVKISAASNAFGSSSAKDVTLGAGDTVNVAAGIDTTNGLNVVLKDASGAADNVAITLSDMTQGKIAIAQDANTKSVEAITVTSAGKETAGNTLTTLAAGNTTTLNVAGSQKVVIGAVELNDPSTTGATAVIDASTATGGVTLGSSSADFKTTNADEVTVKLGSGTNKVYFDDALLAADSVTGSTGTDTVYYTEKDAAATTLEATLTNVDTLVITAVAGTSTNDTHVSAKNFTNVGKIQVQALNASAGTQTGSQDLTLDKIAAGQAIEVLTSKDGGGSPANQVLESLTVKGATGVTSAAVTLKGSDGVQYASSTTTLTVATDVGSLTLTDAIVDANSKYANQYVTVDGTASTANLTKLTLSGGGATASAGTNSKITVAAGSNVALTDVNASGYNGNIDLSNIASVTAAGVKVTAGSGDNAITIAAADAARDQAIVDGGLGADVVAFTAAAATAATGVDYRPGLKGVETVFLTVAADEGSPDNGTVTLNLTDTTDVTTVKVDLVGGDAVAVTNGATVTALKLGGGSSETAANAVSIAGATTLTVSNYEQVGKTNPGNLTAGDATTLTIKQGNGSDMAFATVTVAKATSMTVGGADIDSGTNAAYAGAIALTSLSAAELTSLALNSEGGALTLSNLTAAKLASVTVTGDNAVSFGGSSTTTAKLASFDASAAKVGGDVTIAQGVDFTSSATVKFGAGNDKITLDILTEGTLTVDGGSNTTAAPDSDTLYLAGANNMGMTVIDLTAADHISQLNGGLNAAVQSNFENIDLSGLSGSFGANITGTSGANTIVGSKNADNIVAGEGIDSITGGDGADTIDLTEATAVLDTLVYTATTQGGDTVTSFAGGSDKLKFLESAFTGFSTHALVTTTNSNTYAETTTALSSSAQDLNGSGANTGGVAGFVVVGAATGTAGVSVYYTTEIGAATDSNSTLIATLSGINTTQIAATDFLGY